MGQIQGLFNISCRSTRSLAFTRVDFLFTETILMLDRPSWKERCACPAKVDYFFGVSIQFISFELLRSLQINVDLFLSLYIEFLLLNVFSSLICASRFFRSFTVLLLD